MPIGQSGFTAKPDRLEWRDREISSPGGVLGGLMMRVIVLCVCLCLFVTAAWAGQSDRDDPPVAVTDMDCSAAFKRYSEHYMPLHFARSADDETCVFTHCDSACREGISEFTALALCNHASNGSPCEIYAYRGAVVATRPAGFDGAAGD